MALTRLDNLYSSKTGKYLYVSPDDFNATDELDNRGNSPLRPFKTIQRAFIEVARYSFLPAEGGESVPDRFDQFSIMLMPGDHYIDNRPGLVNIESGDNLRYFDSKNLITVNRQEIIDRAFGQITIDYDEAAWGTDWVVPGDVVLPNGSPDPLRRGQSAYRLIQKNKDYIQASSVAKLSVEYDEATWGSDWVIPMDSAATPASGINFNRRAGAYRLIQKNRTDIIDAAHAAMIQDFPTANSLTTKCKRDMGSFLDYISLDMFYGSVKYTRDFTKYYFDGSGPRQNFTPTDVTYDPSTGISVFTVPNHGLSDGDLIRVEDNSIYFTCGMDGNLTEHSVPTPGTGASNRLPIYNSTTNTFQVDVGASGPNVVFTPTIGTSYDHITGDLVLEVGSHSLTAGEGITIDTGSLGFTCDMDGDVSTKFYPRVGHDQFALRSLKIKETTATSFTVNIGPSPANKYLTPGAGTTYDPGTGDLVMVLGQHGLKEGQNIALEDNSFTFTCDMDNDATEKTYPRPGDDPFAGKSIPIGNVGFNSHDIESADYDAASGNIVITITGHGFQDGDYVMVEDSALGFTCLLDGNTVTKYYPRQYIDYPSNRWIEISNTSTNEFTINVGPSEYTGSHTFVPGAENTNGLRRQNGNLTINIGTPGPDVQFTPSAADYNHSTGELELTIGSHTLDVGEGITIDDNSLSFTCTMDNNQSVKTYPRAGIDPMSQRSRPITAVSANSITVNIGASPADQQFTPTDSTYDPTTGDLVLQVGQHGIGVGRNIVLEDGAVTFTCAQDGNATNHSYPRSTDPASGSSLAVTGVGSTQHTVTDAPYDASTGIITFTVATHGFASGDYIKIADDSLAYSCVLNSNATNHSYPRAGIDRASNRWLEITKIDDNTFTVDVGPSPYTGSHTFVGAASNGIDRQDGTLTVNVGTTSLVDFTPTDGTYDPATGDLVLTIGTHSLPQGTLIKIADNSLKFKCSMDDYGTVHTYPRVTDPVSGESIAITATTSDSITVNVGQAPLVEFTPTDASFTSTTGMMELTIGDHNLRGADRYTPSSAAYNPTTGIITITINDHGFANGNVVRLDDNALTFECDEDSRATQHTYPRSSDPVSGMWIPISNVTQNTFDVQVLADAPSTNTTTHYFITAAANSVTFPRDSIKLSDGAVTFRCDEDGQATDHAYPRTTVETATVTGADYNPSTGVMEITIANHGLKNNEQIKFADDSLTFTCLEDNNGTNHTYPRSSDPVSDKWLKIFNVQTNTFQVQVLDDLPSTNTTTHTFVSATTNGLSFKKDPFYDNSIYIEEVPSTAATVTDATYDAATGVIVVTSVGHGLSNGNKVKFELGSLTFSCTKDGNATDHSYPRITDPSYDEWLTVANKTNDTFEVNVGISGPNDQYAHTFVSATASGLLKQSGTINVFIGVSSNTTTHAFVSALTNSVKTGGTYTHVWDGADANAVTSGGNYAHIFSSGLANSVKFTPQSAHTFTGAISNSVKHLPQSAHTFIRATSTAVKFEPQSTHTFVPGAPGSGGVNHSPQSVHTFVRSEQNSLSIGGTPIINGIADDPDTTNLDELDASLWAFSLVKGLMIAAISNRPLDTTTTVTINETIDGNALSRTVDTAAWYSDSTLTADPNTGSNYDSASCTDVQNNVSTLSQIALDAFAAGNLNSLPAESAGVFGTGTSRCFRDVGFFIDAISLDVSLGGGNKYTRKYVQNYFTAGGISWVDDGLQGEETQAIIVFNEARNLMQEAISNQLGYKDLTLTHDPSPSSGPAGSGIAYSENSCSDIKTTIGTLAAIPTTYFTQGSLDNFVAETVTTVGPGETKCKRDIGLIIDAVAADLGNGGNGSIIAAAKSYFDKNGLPITNGLLGEESQSVIAFNAAAVWMKAAVTNQLYEKDLTILPGPASYSGYETNDPIVPNLPTGNSAACVDVQASIDTLIGIISTVVTDGALDSLNSVQVTGDIPIFNYNKALQEWQDNSILDLSNPDNVLYKFNSDTGGAIVPRGCSLIGYDLRRTIVRPLYVPDPADSSTERTSIFNLTGGCYLWQFTLKDGDLSTNSPLYDNVAKVGKVYFQKGNNSQLAIPEYSHHKICIMTYADVDDLQLYYNKVAIAFALFQPTIDDGDFNALPQENRIVGPLSDTRSIINLRLVEQTASGKTVIEATTKVAHGYFKEQYIAIIESGLNDSLNGTFKITAIDEDNPKLFRYEVDVTPQQLGLDINLTGYTTPDLSLAARAQAEIDSVESASPYVFNCSIRSTWGICGMWADGSKATGFKSMVVAQYTGVSLQKDDRAFIRYDEFSNTWNQASLTDAFATTAYHTKGDAYWKDDWKNFHIRASDDAFIQCVSVFAVGYFDHFLMESGGDMSITNSNSNFGNTSLHSIGFKGFSFNQDKGGYITDIVPVKKVDTSAFNEENLKYYPLSNQATKVNGNRTRLYYSGDNVYSPFTKPATSIEGYRLGALTNDKVFLKLPKLGGGNDIFESTVSPSGFRQYTTSLETLNPDGVSINNNAQDASNLIETNKEFIQREAYNYIITRYPDLQQNNNITISKCERDIGYIVDAVIQDLRIGGNINTIQAAEAYYVGGTLSYIDGEFNESVEAYEYVKNLIIATMRNFDYLIKNPTITTGSSIINVGSTAGLLVGMTVNQYNYTDIANGDDPATANFHNGRLTDVAIAQNVLISNNSYIRRVIDSERIEIGNSAPVLTTDAQGFLSASFGNAVVANAPGSASGAYLYFEFPKTASGSDSEDVLTGGYSDINPVRDSTVLKDTTVWDAADKGYPECNDILSLIEGYFSEFFLILNNGLTPLGGTEVDAHNLILANKTLIATEAVERMLTYFPGFAIPGGNQECIDDVELFLEAIAYNIKYGGNSKVYDGSLLYIQQPGLLEGERIEAAETYIEMRALAISAMKNEPITIQGSHGLTQVIDNNVLGDTSSQAGVYDFANDCAGLSQSIVTLVEIILASTGAYSPANLAGATRTEPAFNVATRVEPVVDTANLASRATLFTINTGGSTSDPHLFETGTPIRLVPKVRSGVDPATVDKRVIRLPKGFNTNTIYYVIAPGRSTEPEDYSDGVTYPNVFERTNTTKLMLATTKENAAAGIYMYSPETDSVDYDVEIGLNQFVLDESYDLHQYICNFPTGSTDLIQTDVPHIFDVPGTIDVVHEVFFRTFGTNSTLPQITIGGVTSEVDTNKYYYVRFVTPKTFAVFNTKAEAIAGSPRITFAPNFGANFYTFANKRVSPVKFDPTRDDSALIAAQQETTTGQWYINTTDDYDPAVNIQARMNEIGQDLKDSRSKNTSFKRLEDERTAQDRIYRLRYVIPKYADGVRDPLNGFVIKARTDETRKLVPQKILLKPTAAGLSDVALFETQIQLTAGGTLAQQLGLPSASLDPNFAYDPYLSAQVKKIPSDRVASKTSFSIQSARQVDVSGTNYLELTVFDHTITDDAIRNEQFVTVKINAPQGGGGAFRINTSVSNNLNKILWNGFSSGFAFVQGYFNPDGTNDHYLVLKGLDDDVVRYDRNSATTFSQPVLDADNDPVLDGNGNQVLIYATLQAKPNSVGSPNNSLSKSDRKDFLYSDKNSNVLTMTPGDIITDDDGNDYEIASVVDAGQIEDTFYIFDIEEIKRRIPNQQEGIYYLTCIKGNISPFPTGPGVGTNFHGFKFSQPIGQLYPLDYKNDPLWFQVRPDDTRDNTILDTDSTVCAADNFIHGLVTTNDFKNSETKEVVLDFIENPALNRFEYTTNKIEAQDGNAASGSEDRLIPISGDSVYPTENKLYVELRRPSIARSGNHTFEYLGFGPGNYSTGFPLRQEVVLSDIQDFYAQAKRENGGIVFYTGLNSNGDLYIGNRKINAITGEETFLEKAELLSSEDDAGDIGGLVTTFELPVAFEQEITVDGNALFNNPVTINVDDNEPNAFTVVSNVDSNSGGDLTLDSASWNRSTIASEGNVVIHQNQIFSAIYRLNPRGSSLLSGQDYSIRTHVDQNNGNTPTNKTPNQTNSAIGMEVKYGTLANSASPTAGDILLKGEEIGRTGSLGWVYANFYQSIESNIESTTAIGDGTVPASAGPKVRFNMATGESPTANGIEVGSIVKIAGLTGRFININGIREVESTLGDSFVVSAPVVIDMSAVDDPTALPVAAVVSVSQSKWTETSLIGAETLRTDTTNNGDYKLGINTLARSAHSDFEKGFSSSAVDPRANLDVVGTVYISGKTLAPNGYDNFPLLANRSFAEQNNALLVGGDSSQPNLGATFRVATTNGLQGNHSGQATGTARTVTGGRVGINVTDGDTNHTLTVVGDMRLTENALFEENLQINGGSLSTLSPSFSLLDGGATTVYFASEAKNLFIGNSVSGGDTTEAAPQIINISPTADHQEVNIGTFTDDGIFKVHSGGSKSSVDIGTSNLTATDAVSVIRLGGAYAKQSNSLVNGSVVKLQTRFTQVDGDLDIGTALVSGTGVATLSSPAQRVNLFTVTTSKLYIGSAASRTFIGAQGGFTQINNSLVVKSSTTLEGDVTLSGGLNSGEFEVRRGSFATDAIAHIQGDSDNANIDLFTKSVIGQFVDKASGFFGGTNDAVGGTAASDEYYLPFTTPANTTIFEVGAFLLIDRSRLAIFDPTAFTANVAANSSTITSVTNAASFDTTNTWVRIDVDQDATFADGTKYAQITGITGTTFTLSKSMAGTVIAGSVKFTGGDSTQGAAEVGEQYSELVQILELTNLNNITNDSLKVKVKRAMNQRNTVDGSMIAGTPANLPGSAEASSFKYLRTDHPDNTELIRYDLAEDVSFVDQVNGLGGTTSGTLEDVNTGDFSGSVGAGDILRFTDSELAIITEINTTSPQRFVVTDGSDNAPVEQFSVDSTTGETNILGDVTINANFTLAGSTTAGSQVLKITNGDTVNPVTNFRVDSANGNVCLKGDFGASGPNCDRLTVNAETGLTTISVGDFLIGSPIDQKLILQNSTGNLTIAGHLTVQGTTETNIAGPVQIDGGNFQLNKIDQSPDWTSSGAVDAGDTIHHSGNIYTVVGNGTLDATTPPTHTTGTVVNGTVSLTFLKTKSPEELFEVEVDGSMNFAGQEGFFTPNGARKWEFVGAGEETFDVKSNVNYFVAPSSDTTLKLPENPSTGDMIRVVDVGGNLTYNVSLRVRAKDNVAVQGDNTNGNTPDLSTINYDGGELIVQTPHAGFGLIFLGSTNFDGTTTGAPSTTQGWWLVEI